MEARRAGAGRSVPPRGSGGRGVAPGGSPALLPSRPHLGEHGCRAGARAPGGRARAPPARCGRGAAPGAFAPRVRAGARFRSRKEADDGARSHTLSHSARETAFANFARADARRAEQRRRRGLNSPRSKGLHRHFQRRGGALRLGFPGFARSNEPDSTRTRILPGFRCRARSRSLAAPLTPPISDLPPPSSARAPGRRAGHRLDSGPRIIASPPRSVGCRPVGRSAGSVLPSPR